MVYARCVICLFVTLGVVSAAIQLDNLVTTPQRCSTPQLWQADVRITQELSIGGKGMSQYMSGHIWYDRQNKTSAFDGILVMNGVESQLNYIEENAAKKQYNINRKEKTCQVMTQAFPYFDGCIPEGAKFMGREILGKHFMVNTWSGEMQGDTFNIHYEMTVTPDCIPVTTTAIGEVSADWGKTGLTTSSRLSDFHEGIRDLSVFDIPDYCEK